MKPVTGFTLAFAFGSALALVARVAAAQGPGAIPVQRNVQVDIITSAREIVITGGAGYAVSVAATSDAPGGSRPVPKLVYASGLVTIRDGPFDSEEIQDAHYIVSVPRDARVTVESSHGGVRVSGVSVASVTTNDGAIVVTDISGDVKASSILGAVDVSRVRGSVSAISQTNTVSVSEVMGETSVRSTTGTIELRSIGGDVSAVNTSGEIHLGGTVAQSASYNLETHSGQIRIALAPTVSARFSVNAPDGALRVRLPGIRVTKNDGRERTLSIGNGGARISARTCGGGVDIDRAY